MNIWKKLRTIKHAGNDHWDYNIDTFLLDEQREREYHYVHTEGSTMVIPILPDNTILLVKQFRYLNQKSGLEFPCGAVQKGLLPHENAMKELREETGYRAENLSKIGAFTPYTGASDEVCHLFAAENLVIDPLPPDETEDIELVPLTFHEIEEKVLANEIWDGLTLAAWAISNLYLRKKFNV